MKSLLSLSIIASFIFSVSSNAQSSFTVVEASTGVMAVQGEMQDNGTNALNTVTTLSIHSRPYKSKRISFGGSVSFYTTNMGYSGSKGWLDGHATRGTGINPQLSARILLSGRDDMRFMKHAFITYLEMGAGAHFISNRSTYPPATQLNKVAPVEGDNELDVAPSLGASLGFQYFISYSWGVTLRLNGQYVNSDRLDGIEGFTEVNDYQVAATLGMLYAF